MVAWGEFWAIWHFIFVDIFTFLSPHLFAWPVVVAKAAHMCFAYLDMHMLHWSGLFLGCSWAGGALLLGCHVLVHAKPSICIACCAEDL